VIQGSRTLGLHIGKQLDQGVTENAQHGVANGAGDLGVGPHGVTVHEQDKLSLELIEVKIPG
jgi:hypothetical protein